MLSFDLLQAAPVLCGFVAVAVAVAAATIKLGPERDRILSIRASTMDPTE